VYTFSFSNISSIAGTYSSNATPSAYPYYIRKAVLGPKVTTQITPGTVVLNWKAMAGKTQYLILRRNADGTLTRLAMTSGTTYTDDSITDGGTFSYIVAAYDTTNGELITGSNGIYGNTVTVPALLTAPVLSATASLNGGKPILSWPEVPHAAGYRIYRSDSVDGDYQFAGETSAATWTDKLAASGSVYYYYAVSLYEDGTETTPGESIFFAYNCEAPTVAVTNVASSGKVKLTWEEVDGAETYMVYRSTSKNGTYKKMYSTGGTRYTNTSAKPGFTYYYKIVAVGEAASTRSDYSKIIKSTCDLARPTVTTSKTGGKPTLAWKPIQGATAYKVYRSTSKSGKYTLLKTVTDTTYIHAKAKKGTTYYYKVRAVCDKTAAASAFSYIKKIKCTK